MNESAEQSHGAGVRAGRNWRPILLLIGLVLVVGVRVVATRTESINWDEFVLLHHAAWSIDSGELRGGGRPGLAVLLVAPFVAGCEDEISVLRRVRLVWLGITFAFIAGLAVLLAQLRPESSRRWGDAVLGVALLACVPAFLVWSLQVRTDQIALAGGVWGGVALLASRRRPLLAVLAGLLFGLGILSSQKAIYVGGLVGVLVLGDLWRSRDTSFTRESRRGILCLGSLGLVLVGFYSLTPHLFSSDASSEVVASSIARLAPTRASGAYQFQMGVFDYYRQTIGFSRYVEMLPTLVPHFVLLAAMFWATWRGMARGTRIDEGLVLAWLILGLGSAVCLFHAGAFEYFWMTLGLFPAVAFVLARDSLESLLAPLGAGLRRGIVIVFWGALLVPGALASANLLKDTQAVQRESLAFSHRNFSAQDTGFQIEAGLFCREDPHRFPPYFSQNINRLFGPQSRCETCAPDFIADFIEKQVKFVVASYRMAQFPPIVQQFWQENYLHYRSSVLVAGKLFEGREESESFELVVDGEYLWLPHHPPAEIDIDGTRVTTGGRIHLARGRHVVRFEGGESPGILVLAMNEPPRAPLERFYRTY